MFIKKISYGKKIKNKIIAEIKAKIKTILIAERTALTFSITLQVCNVD